MESPITHNEYVPTIGQVVVTEGSRGSAISKTVAWATGSWFTHAFLVTGPDEAAEAWFPRVRTFNLTERMKELREENRAYAVLELSGMSAEERQGLVSLSKRTFLGRFYDVGQAILYGLFRRFVSDGPGTLICSRYITASFHAGGYNLFPAELVARRFASSTRKDNLTRGQVIPSDLLMSRLSVVRWSPSPTLSHWRACNANR